MKSFIESGHCNGGSERLCVIESRLRLERFTPPRIELDTAGTEGQCLTH